MTCCWIVLNHRYDLWNILFSRYISACKAPLPWRHNDHDGVSNHQSHGCLLNRLFRHRSKKTSMLRVTGLCAGNSPGTGEFPAQMASYAENVSIWWRHHASDKWDFGVEWDYKKIGPNFIKFSTNYCIHPGVISIIIPKHPYYPGYIRL